jgi:Zinc-ribbon
MHDSRCPVCKKTAESRERMMPTWNAMAAGIALQPVPPELARVVDICCNDCETGEKSRSWHFLGMQCSTCSSFNTVVDRILLQGDEAYDFLRRQQQQLQQQQCQAAAAAAATVTATTAATMLSSTTTTSTTTTSTTDPAAATTAQQQQRQQQPRSINRRRSVF